MKTKERHHLKENEFITTVARVVDVLKANRDRAIIGVAVLAVIGASIGGYFWMKNRSAEQAGELFGMAMAVYESPITPAPTIAGAPQTPGTYVSEAARSEAALAAFQKVAATYPSAPAGIAAMYQSGELLMSLGRLNEAQQTYQMVVDRAGNGLYGPFAKLGLAESLLAGAEYDKSIKIFEQLAAQRDGTLPVDGLLAQLAEAYKKAGKASDAHAALKRIVDEFPESPYVATARQELASMG